MGSYRIGGLAVALGIGSAVVAGHGVAFADTSGESGSESPLVEFVVDGSVRLDRIVVREAFFQADTGGRRRRRRLGQNRERHN